MLEQTRQSTKTAGRLYLHSTGKIAFKPYIYPSRQIKEIGFTRWDAAEKIWLQARPHVSKQVIQDVQMLFGDIEIQPELLQLSEPEQVKLPKWLQEHPKLFDYQKEAIQFGLTHKHALLGLAPGLGKTACAIMTAEAAQAERVLVVSPLALLYNWRKEIKAWAGGEADIWHKSTGLANAWTITNYATVLRKPTDFLQQFDFVIIDESIIVKNRKAKITQTLAELLSQLNPQHLLLLSGSPVSRLYDDLWAQLNLLNPNRFSSFWRFTKSYCHVESNQWSAFNIVANKPDAAERLKRDLADIYFARTQDQVLNLPDWIFQTLEIPMSSQQTKLYGQMESDFMAELHEDETLLAPNVLSQLTRLVQLASNPVLVGGKESSPKWDAVAEMLGWIDLPAIVWTNFISTAKTLSQRLSKTHRVATLTGETPAKERQEIVDAFQADQLDVIIAHPAVGKFGLTLTKARTAIYLERSYNGDDYYQSLHRVRRIGTEQSPQIFHLLSIRPDGAKTIDHAIDAVLQSRRDGSVQLTTGLLKETLGYV